MEDLAQEVQLLLGQSGSANAVKLDQSVRQLLQHLQQQAAAANGALQSLLTATDIALQPSTLDALKNASKESTKLGTQLGRLQGRSQMDADLVRVQVIQPFYHSFLSPCCCCSWR